MKRNVKLWKTVAVGIGLLSLTVGSSMAQPIEKWVTRYNGQSDSGLNFDGRAVALAVDADNNTYTTGTSNGEFTTVKYDSDGNQLWVARYNRTGNTGDRAVAMAVDADNNIYVTGSRWSDVSFHDYATIKYDSDGNQIWVALYDGPANSSDHPVALAVDTYNNIYVTGKSYGGNDVEYDFATVKYDSDGNQIWVNRYDSPIHSGDEPSALTVDVAGNVYVTGGHTTVMYDSVGNQLWVASLDDTSAKAIAVDSTGNVYITGGVNKIAQIDFGTVKYDSNGIEQWAAYYNGPASLSDYAEAIAVDSEGNIYVAGYDSFFGGRLSYTIIKYEPNGNQSWVRHYTGPAGVEVFDSRAVALAVDADNNIFVTGYSLGITTDYDYATVKYDPDGNQTWVVRYNGTGNSADRAQALALDNFGNIYVTGYSWGDGTRNDYVTIKYSSNHPPVADAGTYPDHVCTNLSGTPATLDGSNSSDPDGDTLAYTWTGPFLEGGGIVMDAAPTVTLPMGTSNISLVVNDGQEGSDPDTVDITIICTPQQHIGLIIDEVNTLVADGILGQGEGNALTRKLEDAIKHLNRGKPHQATMKLEEFISQVNAKMQAGTLSSKQGQFLIDAANDVIVRFSN